ncbi:hypothetical protein HPB48_000896 [Haemaphysalis longicornis]|uniref:Major facilitator superfamily (MFS) profile domain-containing protein n=1 Tax=Haemaphysalis longicornis TaxID=44386 RepID=A0A9J6GRI6_HAELO|nr:hypothetical protein HPB48_000896 [Haemaphysalis longicornis]
MASTPSKAAQASMSTVVAPATCTAPPPRTDDGSLGPEARAAADENMLKGFRKADSAAVLLDNVYIILGHGTYQNFVVCAIMLSGFTMLVHNFAYKLVARRVPHWCRPPDSLKHLTPDVWRNVAIPLLPDGTLSGCTVYDPPMENEDAERREKTCDEWDYADRGSHDSIISKWNLVCNHEWLYKLSLLLYIMSPVISLPVVGVLSDRFGRRPVIVAMVSTCAFASMVSAIANTFLMFLAARFLVSTSSLAAATILFILLYEVTCNEHRAIYGFISVGVPLTLGPTAVNVISWLQPSWYLAQGFLVVPTILLALWCSLLKESPAWLIATWNTLHAKHVMLTVAKANGVDPLKARVTFRALEEQMKLQETSTPSPLLMQVASPGSALLSGSALSVALASFTLTLTLYALVLPSGPETWTEIGTHLALQTLIYAAMSAYMLRRGYRYALWLNLILLSVFLGFFSMCYFEDYTTFMAPFGHLAELAANSGMTINICYTSEAFPTVRRGKGLLFSMFVGRFGALFGTLTSLDRGRTTLVAIRMLLAVLAIATAVCVQWLPEVVLFKQKKKEVLLPVPELMSEKERKEAIKASLSVLRRCSKTSFMSARSQHRNPEQGHHKPARH